MKEGDYYDENNEQTQYEWTRTGKWRWFLGRIADGYVTITLGFMVFLAKQEGKTWEQFCDQIDAKNRSSEMLELLKGMWFSSDK